MPELPDLTIYLEALESRVLGQTLTKIKMVNLFVLRTAVPPIDSLVNRRVTAFRRLGKRIAFGFEGDRWLVLHLMIAGRLQWTEAGAKSVARNILAEFVFSSGTLGLTEAGTQRRASLHVVDGEAGLAAYDPGGIDVMTATEREFSQLLTRTNHTLKRALADPRLFSGIGNAYSDEILHAAKLSLVMLTQKLTRDEIQRLFKAVRSVLSLWIYRLRHEVAGGWPKKVTAFHPAMAVHGKFGQPCPICGANVQRIVYAANEVNYWPRCQTGGKLLADRSLSRLLKSDWPRTIDEVED